MSENDNWRAKCAGTIIRIRLLGAASDHESYLPHQDAAELRDQLTAALEEAKRLEDPFERWWAGLPKAGTYKPEYARDIGGVDTPKAVVRAIWDAARKAAP